VGVENPVGWDKFENYWVERYFVKIEWGDQFLLDFLTGLRKVFKQFFV